MKKYFLIFTLFAFFLPLNGQNLEELERRGDLLQEDGFIGLSWKNYFEASVLTREFKESSRLLNKLIRTAIGAGKEAETLKLAEKYTQTFVNDFDLSSKVELALKLSYLNIQLKKYGEAIKLLEPYEGKLGELKEELRTGLVQTKVYALVSAGQSDDASNYIQKNLSLLSESTITELELLNVRLQINSGKYVGAITILEKYENSTGELLPLFLNMWAYLNAGENEKSLVYYEKIKINIQSKSAEPGKMDGVKAFLKDPDLPLVLIRLAESLDSEKYQEAISILEEVNSLVTAPEMKEELSLRKIERYMQAGKTLEAIEELKIFLQKYPTSTKGELAKFQLAELYFDNKPSLPDKSLELIELLLAVKINDPKLEYQTYLLKGKIKEEKGEFDEAAKNYISASEIVKLKKLSPYFEAFAFYKAAAVKYEEGLKKGSVALFSTAADYFYKSAQIDSVLTEKSMLMQIQSLRRAELLVLASKMSKQWLRIYPKNIDLSYLFAINQLESGNLEDGLKQIKQFIEVNKNDSRVPMAYVYVLQKLIYSRQADRYRVEIDKLIKEFDQLSAMVTADNQFFREAIPYVLHLRAIYDSKLNISGNSEKLWQEFIQKYPTHPAAAEANLWLGFRAVTKSSDSYTAVVKYFNAATVLLGENSLKVFAFNELAKVYYKLQKFQQAAASLETAIATAKNLSAASGNSNQLAELLFFAGDVYSRSGEYLDKAIPKFDEALSFATSEEAKIAIRGRTADCYLAAAFISLNSEKIDDFKERVAKAIEIYTDLSSRENLPINLADCVLYKLAKCYEAKINTESVATKSLDLAKALDIYQKLFFGYFYDKNKLQRDHYFFCRAGYDLGRLQMKSGDIESAITTYETLYSTKILGTGGAKELANYLKIMRAKGEEK